jgi:putative membrane protein
VFRLISIIFVALVAIEHLYIMVMEMFLWTRPRTMKTFGLTPELAESTKSLAANQGLYNGFLAAGLIWGLVYPDGTVGQHIQIFFLACVIIAAIYGALTATRSIIIKQGLPAIIAMLLVIFL